MSLWSRFFSSKPKVVNPPLTHVGTEANPYPKFAAFRDDLPAVLERLTPTTEAIARGHYTNRTQRLANTSGENSQTQISLTIDDLAYDLMTLVQSTRAGLDNTEIFVTQPRPSNVNVGLKIADAAFNAVDVWKLHSGYLSIVDAEQPALKSTSSCQGNALPRADTHLPTPSSPLHSSRAPQRTWENPYKRFHEANVSPDVAAMLASELWYLITRDTMDQGPFNATKLTAAYSRLTDPAGAKIRCGAMGQPKVISDGSTLEQAMMSLASDTSKTRSDIKRVVSEHFASKPNQAREQKTSTQSDQASPLGSELQRLKDCLAQSLDARQFIVKAGIIGFKFDSESAIGVSMTGKQGDLLFGVFESIHPTNIGILSYMPRGGDVVELVSAGTRQF